MKPYIRVKKQHSYLQIGGHFLLGNGFLGDFVKGFLLQSSKFLGFFKNFQKMPHLAPGRNATSTYPKNVAEESVIETPSSLPIMADHLEPRHTEHHQKSEQIYVNISHVNLTVPSLPASNEAFTTTVRPTIIIYPTGRH